MEHRETPFLAYYERFGDLATAHINGFGTAKVNREFKIPILGKVGLSRSRPYENDNNTSLTLMTGSR
jgi:hypothetical protein